MNRIIYQNQDGTVAIFAPSPGYVETVGITAVAEKVVPKPYQYPVAWETNEYGVQVETEFEAYYTPYWIVTDSDIPSDRSQRDAWQIDETMGDPDGFGGASNEFTDEQLLQLYNAGVIG